MLEVLDLVFYEPERAQETKPGAMLAGGLDPGTLTEAVTPKR